MFGKFDNIKIQGMCTAVPSTIESNDIYTDILGERRTKKQIKLTGVNKRQISAQDQKPADLCYSASKRLLEHLKWNTDEIKVLVLITQTPNFVIPSTSFFLHKKLGLPQDCLTFDINLGCSSFNVGIQTVASLMQSLEIGEKGLLLVGDTAARVKSQERFYNEGEITHDMLFGSEGTCIALEKVVNNDLCFVNMSDGERYQAIIQYYGRPTHMDGSAVFNFAINDVTKTINDFKAQFNIAEESIDYYIFHQAQQLILENIAAECKIPEEKELRSLSEFGNTSGGSVPLTLSANIENLKEKDELNILFCGFGVGLSWGCIYTRVEKANILPVIISDEHEDDIYYDGQEKMDFNVLANKELLIFGADTPIGEWIARNNKKSGAKLILGASNTANVTVYTEELINKPKIIEIDHDNGISEKTLEPIKDDLKDIDGVVFTEDIDVETFRSFCSFLDGQEELREISVVILGKLDPSVNEPDVRNHIDQLFAVSGEMNHPIRVNAVLYHDDTMKIVPIRDNGQKWIEEFVTNGCPDDMVKSAYVAHSVAFLISDKGRYINNSILTQK